MNTIGTSTKRREPQIIVPFSQSIISDHRHRHRRTDFALLGTIIFRYKIPSSICARGLLNYWARFTWAALRQRQNSLCPVRLESQFVPSQAKKPRHDRDHDHQSTTITITHPIAHPAILANINRLSPLNLNLLALALHQKIQTPCCPSDFILPLTLPRCRVPIQRACVSFSRNRTEKGQLYRSLVRSCLFLVHLSIPSPNDTADRKSVV